MPQLGQAWETRLSRLAEGRCPIHGHSMKLVREESGLRVVLCPRVRCDLTGVQSPPGRAVRLSPAQERLLSATYVQPQAQSEAIAADVRSTRVSGMIRR